MPFPSNSLDVNLTAINAITKKYWVPELHDQVETSNPVLMKMPKKTIDGGDDIRQPVRFARGSVTNYSGSENLTTSYIEKKTNLIFNWKQKNANVTILGIDKLKNQGAAKVIDHVQSEIQAAKDDLIDNFGTGIYSSGTDTKEIDGARIFLSTSNTYGGISQASESWLQAQIDSTTTTLSLAKMQELYEAASQPPDRPGFISTDETEFNAFWGLLQPAQRFSNSDTAKAGFRNLMYNGAELTEDAHCPAGFMVFWNFDHIALYSHSSRKFPGVFIDFDMPINQDLMVGHFRWMGNMICAEPRKFAAMTALTG